MLISGSDFTASVNKAVTFRPLEEMKMVMVPIREDEVFEGEEVFTARLSVGPDSNGVVIGRQGTATTSIIDGTITVADRDSVICIYTIYNGFRATIERNCQVNLN